MESIRIGLLVDDLVMPAWQCRAVELISRVPGSSIVLVVAQDCAEGRNRSRRVGTFMFDMWKKVDRRVFRMDAEAFRRADASRCLGGIPVLRSQAGSAPGEAVQREIARHRPTVFLQLGDTEAPPALTRIAPCGVWALRIGEHQAAGTREPGMREVLLNRRTVPTFLRMRRMAAGVMQDVAICRSWSATHPLSLYRTVNRCYWKGASFFARLLRRLAQVGPDAFLAAHAGHDPRAQPDPHGSAAPRIDSFPAARLGGMLYRLLSAGLTRILYREQWLLMYRSGRNGPLPDMMRGLQALVPPADRFWADPCIVRYRGRNAVFIEELEYAKKKGHISVIEFDQDGAPSLPPVKVLEQPYHLSYPFVFEDQGELFMIPEAHESRTVAVYRCTRFPDQWEWVMNLMEDVVAVDPTLWRHDGKYWLFMNVMEQDGCSSADELFLYWSDSLLSRQWCAHPANPVVTDARRARPAGRIFEHEGVWYRPSQDCGGAYGRAMCVNRIDTIDESSYQETPVWYIEPDGGQQDCRTHTLAMSDGLLCADAMTLRSKIALAGTRMAPVLRTIAFPRDNSH